VPEAVIVATARSPIGRADKSSLTAMRPDHLTVQMLQAALAKAPHPDPSTIDDLILGCGQPAGEAGNNLARVVAVLAGLDSVPGTTVNRYCSPSLQTTRMAFHAIKAGEGLVLVSAGVETCSRFLNGFADGWPDVDVRSPKFARTGPPRPRGRRDLERPAPGRPSARRLHPDGADRGGARRLRRSRPA
jgi:acetyl-CoA C-acetyltransferase